MEEMDFVPDYNEDGLLDPEVSKPSRPPGPSHQPKTPPPARKKHQQLCPQPGCGMKTNKLRRHVIRYHIANDGRWFLFPLLTCWKCQRCDIALHVDLHGPFGGDHLPELAERLNGFVHHVCSKLELAINNNPST